ncbi:MAG: hypothetical protein SGPRY_013972 [Prymnesium sp.]
MQRRKSAQQQQQSDPRRKALRSGSKSTQGSPRYREGMAVEGGWFKRETDRWALAAVLLPLCWAGVWGDRAALPAPLSIAPPPLTPSSTPPLRPTPPFGKPSLLPHPDESHRSHSRPAPTFSLLLPPQVVKSIDKLLVKTMRSLCDFRKGTPPSPPPAPPWCTSPTAGLCSQATPHPSSCRHRSHSCRGSSSIFAAHLPVRLLLLTREECAHSTAAAAAVRTSGFSPDETAYFRLLATSLSVYATLVLVQPTLTGYEAGKSAGIPLPLDPSAIGEKPTHLTAHPSWPQRSLLLDTYLQIVLCHGAHVAAWQRSQDFKPGTDVHKLVSAAQQDLKRHEEERFPAPETFECEQYSSKARYLVQKLNPDVPLSEFLQGLYKAVVG